ncbi:MAG: hypothetical protein A2Z72_05840 [Omnitrophica bacterium RBG_13_46_9]|nr:MAG: hypothetical protein A2Z72_05840 [Omnitrophica bacterium RBG_13_46_9]
MQFYAIWWFFIIIIVAYNCFRKDTPTAGLSLAFLLGLSVEHWFGGIIYSFPWYKPTNYDTVILGFEYSTYAITSLYVGNVIFAPFIVKTFQFSWLKVRPHAIDPKLPKIYLATGVTFYFILAPVLRGIISFRTLVFSSWYLIIVGICLGFWNAWRLERHRELFYWLIAALMSPFFTMITEGFLGPGIMSLLSILCFVSVFYRPKWKVILGAALSIYLGLSLFITYMDYRKEIRDLVWAENPTPLLGKAGVVFKMMSNFKFINLYNTEQLAFIDGRLNQNQLVGSAVKYLQDGSQPYAEGETIAESVLAMIPRILWPEKPIVLGGADLVTRYTGIEFARGTSVGMGLIMELYINFGIIGIIVGFILLGIIIKLVDMSCGYRLMQGDWQGFTYLFLPVICLVGSISFVHITMTISAAIVFCVVVNKILMPRINMILTTRRSL